MCEIYTININRNLNSREYEMLLKLVSAQKQERISRFRMPEDAQRTLLGDVLARYAICGRENVKNNDLHFTISEYGKPLVAAPGEVFFNISHSGNRVVCAVDDNPIGIDVEKVKPIDLGIAERFFSEEEYSVLNSKPEKEKMEYFYVIWTLKESFIKAEGKGLSIPLNSFAVSMAEEDILVKMGGNRTKYSLKTFHLDSNHICSVCSLHRGPFKRIDLEMNEFITNIFGFVQRSL